MPEITGGLCDFRRMFSCAGYGAYGPEFQLRIIFYLSYLFYLQAPTHWV